MSDAYKNINWRCHEAGYRQLPDNNYEKIAAHVGEISIAKNGSRPRKEEVGSLLIEMGLDMFDKDRVVHSSKSLHAPAFAVMSRKQFIKLIRKKIRRPESTMLRRCWW